MTESLFYQPHTRYALTIAPQDKYQYVGRVDRFKLCSKLLIDTMKELENNGIEFCLYPELSEPRNINGTIGPRFHVHGVLLTGDTATVKYLLLDGIYKMSKLGIVDIDTIKDHQKWFDYCTKQRPIIKARISSVHNYMELFFPDTKDKSLDSPQEEEK